MTTVLIGFASGLSLIVAIGAQNAFVLRQGLIRQHVGVIVIICALADAILVAGGIAGLGRLIEAVPLVIEIVRWAGCLFLLTYAVMALRRAIRPHALNPSERQATSLKTSVLTCLALTFLNPHVYLDTVILLGSLANQHGEVGRWKFGLGAAVASVLWFSTLGFGARWLRPLFAKPMAWRVLDAVIAAVMAFLAIMLIVS